MLPRLFFITGLLTLSSASGRAQEPNHPTSSEDPPLESRLVLRYKEMELRPDVKLFLDYQASLTNRDSNAFHVTRGYLGFKVKMLKWLSGRVTFDISQATDVGQAGAAPVVDSKVEVDASKQQGSFVGRLKYANIEVGLPFMGSAIAFGMIHTPWIYWVEHIEGTRFLRKVMIEQEYDYPSADLGIALFGHVLDYVDYAVGLYNGAGYAGIEAARFKDIVGRVSVRPLPQQRWLSGLQLSGTFQVEVPTPATGTTHRRYGGGVTWRLADAILSPDCRKVRGDRLALWVQVFGSEDGPVDALARTLGVSVGGRIELPWRLSLVGRYDRFDANLDTPQTARSRGLGALVIKLHEGVKAALDYQGTFPTAKDSEQYVGIHTEFGL